MFTAGMRYLYTYNATNHILIEPFPTLTGPISESDLFTWEALIMGPKDTPFEGGVFAAKLTFVSIFAIQLRECIDGYLLCASHPTIHYLRSK